MMDARYDLFVRAFQGIEQGKAFPRRARLFPTDTTDPNFIYMYKILETLYVQAHDVRNYPLVDINRPLPEIIGGVIDTGTITAVAFHYELPSHSHVRHFIGIDWGAFYLLFELFRRLLSYPDVLPWIGESDKERPRAMFQIAPLRDNIEAIWHTFIDPLEDKDKYPSDKDRRLVAFWLGHITFGSILAHEIRHVYGGHLDHFVNINTTLPLIEELEFTGLTADEGLLRQAYEFDADSAAINSLLGNFLAVFHGNHPNSDWKEYQRFVPTLRHAVELTLLCMDVLFKIFETDALSIPARWPTQSHPPSFIRRANVADTIAFIMKGRGHSGLVEEFEREILTQVSQVSDHHISVLFGKQPSTHPTYPLTSEAIAHKAMIRSTLKSKYADISRFRYYTSGADAIALM